jgi:hypothetical protein
VIGDSHERVELRFGDEEVPPRAERLTDRPPAVEHLNRAGCLGAAASQQRFGAEPECIVAAAEPLQDQSAVRHIAAAPLRGEHVGAPADEHVLVEHDTGVAAGEAGGLPVDFGELELRGRQEAVVHPLDGHRSARRLSGGVDVQRRAAALGRRDRRQQREGECRAEDATHCSPRRLTFSGVVWPRRTSTCVT